MNEIILKRCEGDGTADITCNILLRSDNWARDCVGSHVGLLDIIESDELLKELVADIVAGNSYVALLAQSVVDDCFRFTAFESGSRAATTEGQPRIQFIVKIGSDGWKEKKMAA
jgi:hypothetical protein